MKPPPPALVLRYWTNSEQRRQINTADRVARGGGVVSALPERERQRWPGSRWLQTTPETLVRGHNQRIDRMGQTTKGHNHMTMTWAIGLRYMIVIILVLIWANFPRKILYGLMM